MGRSNELGIGTLAKAAGCTVPTIRYYEEIGLLPKAHRMNGRHRSYGPADLQRLTFIRRCRDFGFSIDQVRELVELAGAPERDCTLARDLAMQHLTEVRRKLKELRALERSLKHYVEDCSALCAGGPASACIILQDLASPEPQGTCACCAKPSAAPQ
jgi:MerR family transcriptional regulator, copper efflux regulator